MTYSEIFLGLFLKRSLQWYALYEIIFCKKEFIDNYVLNLLTFEIVCAQYKRGNSSLYLIFLLMCQFIIECTDVDAFIAALDIELLHYLIRFLWLFRVERLLIGHYHWEWLFSLLFFLCKQFWFDIFSYCSLLIVKMIFRVSHLFEYQLLEIFKVWPF